MSKIPFSAYDFFGYLASGAVTLAAADRFLGSNWIGGDDVSAPRAFLMIVAIYVVGHVVAHLSSVTLEHGLVRRVLGAPEEHLLSRAKPGRMSWVFPGHYKPLPPGTQDRIADQQKRRSGPSESRALFFHAHALVKRDPATLDRLNTFLNLYGFARNMCFALTLATFLLAARALGERDSDSAESDIMWTVMVALGGLAMFYRYLKFFRTYTVEVFQSYAELPPETSVQDNGGSA